MGIFKNFIKDYKKYALYKYDSEVKTSILSNYNEASKFYIIKLGNTTTNGETKSYNYRDHYGMMADDFDFNLYAVSTNGVITELFSGIPVSVNQSQIFKFRNLNLDELNSLDDNYFYAYVLEEITKEDMVKKLSELKNKNMVRYYTYIFTSEHLKQLEEIDKAKDNRVKEKLMYKGEESINSFVKRK